MYEPVRLTVQERTCHVDELSDEVQALTGQIPLEFMDWGVDPRGQRLGGNPEYGSEQTIELY